MVFTDRTQAGNLLAEKLSSYRGTRGIILGLARGGVKTARAVANILKLPLDVLVVKKIGVPGQEELAIGALAPDGVSFIDWRFTQRLGVDDDFVTSQITNLNDQIRQKTLVYRKGKKPYKFLEKVVILVDDGAATGATIEAAIKWLKKKHAKKIVIALPVAPKEFLSKIAPEVDELVILETPSEFQAVGQFYRDFKQIGDKEVVALLSTKSQAPSTR